MKNALNTKVFFAPMEGITGYVFRNAHFKYYKGIDQYYMPFVSPGTGKKMIPRERRDLLPENNGNTPAIPQVLTNQATLFCSIAELALDMGYREINLNLGCPSGTVVTKRKGAGLLAFPEELEKLLDGIFSHCVLPVSIKTRVGKETSEEFHKILSIFNQYPIQELMIHPRVQAQFYKGIPDEDIFEWARNNSKNRLCYNGDINSHQDALEKKRKFHDSCDLMVGRGLLRNPAMFEQEQRENLDYAVLQDFHEEVWTGYQRQMGEERNAMFRMKELWSYLIDAFPHGDELGKRIRKAKTGAEYNQAVQALFSSR